MKCRFCSHNSTQVLASRVVEDGNATRRRRQCLKCKKRFTTYERPKNTFLWVIKKDKSRQAFDKEKIKRGVLRSIEKRPISIAIVEKVVDQVEREMLRKQSQEVSSKQIGKAVLKRLKKLDKVAWLRFASVYLEFENLKDFKKAVKEK